MFKDLKKQVEDNFKKLSKQNTLFYKDIDRDLIFQKYLDGFSPEMKQEHTCNCCKSFLRQYGSIVAIVDNKVISLWDNITPITGFEKPVENLKEYIASLPITNVFLSDIKKCGTNKNLGKENIVWEHFFIEITDLQHICKRDDIDTVKGQKRTKKETLKRSLDELTLDSAETVLELISQGSLYRGSEFKGLIEEFVKLKKEYNKINPKERENYCWLKSTQISPSLAGFRGTVIGTLLEDLSVGIDLDDAVKKFESKVAPTNYKRPTALVTPKMVEQAKEKLTEMGLMDSMERRYANVSDLNIENLLFTDKSSELSDVFQEISKETAVNPKTLTKVEEVTINDFIEKIIPVSKSIEVLLENNHLNNMVSLITGQDKNAKSLFKWDNLFSWSYTGGITDSIKERVKAAGGKVEGELRVSLSWFNYDDLDLHVIEPNGNRIFFRNKLNPATRGHLDVDMNAGSGTTREAVENIIWPDKSRMSEGNYKVIVNNFSKRETKDVGFTVQIEQNGQIYDLSFDKSPSNGGDTNVIDFEYSKLKGITFKKDVKSNVFSKEKWGIKTNTFTKVKNIMLSPNHWEKPVGNKHFFFILENCISDETPRPFFNEFLKEEFNENRKVFEILGSKVKVPDSKQQLSGVGFSDTQRNSLIVRVEGKFKRNIKINF